MKSPYVNELEPNKLITTSFLVHSKEIRQKKSGEFYLSLLLADRTGELDAKMWDNVAEVIDAFDRDDPRGGEADLILAKNRSGPTRTVTVAHQLHLSRFVDMARVLKWLHGSDLRGNQEPLRPVGSL